MLTLYENQFIEAITEGGYENFDSYLQALEVKYEENLKPWEK
jgi:predicted N-acyltransferase